VPGGSGALAALVATTSVATAPLATTPLATPPLATPPRATPPLATTPLATKPLATERSHTTMIRRAHAVFGPGATPAALLVMRATTTLGAELSTET
jgi:hypothetical protein